MTGTSGINVAQIAAPSPNVSGGLWRAPLGTTLPTDTTTALNASFISLGYIDDDGVTKNVNRPNTPKFAWGGQKVASLQESYSVTFTFRLMQVQDPDVLKAVYGDTNVAVTAATQSAGTITQVSLNPTLNVNSAWVIEGYYQLSTFRLAIPIARITQLAPTKYTHKDLAMFDCTMESFPDSTGNFVYELFNNGVLSS